MKREDGAQNILAACGSLSSVPVGGFLAQAMTVYRVAGPHYPAGGENLP